MIESRDWCSSNLNVKKQGSPELYVFEPIRFERHQWRVAISNGFEEENEPDMVPTGYITEDICLVVVSLCKNSPCISLVLNKWGCFP